jgi:hypothetical protein
MLRSYLLARPNYVRSRCHRDGMLHTLVELDDGVLTLRLVSEEDCEVSERRWRAAVRPAIALLRSLGGGGLLVPHRLQELAP